MGNSSCSHATFEFGYDLLNLVKFIKNTYLVMNNLKLVQNLLQIFFMTRPAHFDICKCAWTSGNTTHHFCLSPKIKCHQGCVCPNHLGLGDRYQSCSYCNCQNHQTGGTQRCDMCQCGYQFIEGLGYCNPCDCPNFVCIGNNRPECCSGKKCSSQTGVNSPTTLVIYYFCGHNNYVYIVKNKF